MGNSKTVVRLKKGFYKDSRGLTYKISLHKLKRLSHGYSVMEEIEDNIDYIEPNVINLFEAGEGVYYLETTNISYDWETGNVDDWDYILVPYDPDNTPCDRPKTDLLCTS